MRRRSMVGEPGTESRDEARGVGRRARTGLAWMLMGNVGANIVRLITIPILGRLLSPAEFGAVAAALTVIMLGQKLRDIGIGAALIQTRNIEDHEIEGAAGFSIALGLVLGIITFLLAPVAADFYSIPDLVPITQALAVMFVLRALGSIPRAVCQRELRFRELAVVEFFSFFLGSVATVLFALLGFGLWSLVIGYVLETGSATLALVIMRPTRIRFRLAPVRRLYRFGAGTTIADVAAYFANQGDYMVVGHEFGKEALGIYTRAYELMRFPSTVFTNVVGHVLFAAFARIQHDPERLGRAFRRALFATAILLLPASVGLIVVAPETIRLLLGDQWTDAVLPFQILSLSMMARAAWKIGGALARASGDVYPIAAANIAYGVIIVLGAIIGSRWGIVGVSVAVCTECTIHYLVYSFLGLRRTTLGWSAFAGVHVEALLAAAIAFGAVFATANALRHGAAIDVLVIAGSALAGVVALVAVTLLGCARRQPDWLWLWDVARSKLTKRSASEPLRLD